MSLLLLICLKNPGGLSFCLCKSSTESHYFQLFFVFVWLFLCVAILLFGCRCLAFGLVNDLNIVQRVGAAATFKEDKIKIREKDLLTIPKHKINQVNIEVKIIKSSNKGDKKEMGSASEAMNKSDKFLELISDDSDEEDDVDNDLSGEPPVEEETAFGESPLELFNTGSQYWFCHISLTKHSSTNEEFESLAMRTFPFSFLWLLNECSRIISVHSKKLYSYLVIIEKEHKNILQELEYLVKHTQKKIIPDF